MIRSGRRRYWHYQSSADFINSKVLCKYCLYLGHTLQDNIQRVIQAWLINSCYSILCPLIRMHNIFSRINNVSALFSSCMMALLAAIAISSFIFTADPQGDLGLLSIKVYARQNPRHTVIWFLRWTYPVIPRLVRRKCMQSRNLLLSISTWPLVRPFYSFLYDLYIHSSADLRPLFHWNTKQLFVWVEAEFNNTKKVCGPTCTNEPTPIIPQAENTVIIWDRVVRRKEDADLKVTGKNKYMLRELTKSFK